MSLRLSRFVGVWAAACALLLSTPPPAVAANVVLTTYQWRNVVIEGGGFVPGILHHPTAPDLFYAFTDVGGVYRFDRKNETWRPLHDWIDRAHAEWTAISDIAVDPAYPNRLYAAAGAYPQNWGDPGAFLRSEDRGETWETFPLPCKLLGNADGRNTGRRLLLQPGSSDLFWLASGDDGLWRSDDRGETWARATGLRSGRVTSLAASGGAIYVAFAPDTTGALPWWRSTDGGQTWSALAGQPEGLIAQFSVFDATGRLYVSYADGMGPYNIHAGAFWRYTPSTHAWENLTPLLADGAERADFGFAGIATLPHDPDTVAVASLGRWAQGNEIWLSHDSGRTWRGTLQDATWDHRGVHYTRSFPLHWISRVTLDPHELGRAWFVTGYGLWTTANIDPADASPVQWEFANRGLEETVITELISPPIGAHLLSAVGDIGGFRHDEFDVSPSQGTHAPGGGTSTSIAFAGQAPAELVRTHSGPERAARSSDGGLTWRLVASAPETARQNSGGSIVINADASRLFWLPAGGRVHRSLDDGVTWEVCDLAFQAPNNHRTARLVADQIDPDLCYLYDPQDGVFWVTSDGGESWSLTQIFAIDGGIPRAEPDRTGTVWVPTARGLYVSAEPGRNFQKLARVDAAYQIGFGHPAPGAARSALFVQGRVDGVEGLYRSDDSGQSWVRLDDEAHQFGWLRVVIGDARVFGRVYLGTSGRGIIVGEPTL